MLSLVGVDEVGRGPLAGPVTLCALAVSGSDKRCLKRFLRYTRAGEMKDSKKMSLPEREECAAALRAAAKTGSAISFSISHVSAKVIDRRGIVPAVRLALRRCLNKLSAEPRTSRLLLDGSLHAPKEFTDQKTIVRGDQTVPIIALASVLAKVARDRKMRRLSKRHPGYGFDEHVGYGTSMHYRAIRRLGLSEIHRRSFLTRVKV